MVIVPVLAACMAMSAPSIPTPQMELEAAAASLTKLMDFDPPKDVEPKLLAFRTAQIEALGAFVRKNIDVFASGSVRETESANFIANWAQANRDYTTSLRALKFPSGVIKTYRIQSESFNAMRRFVQSQDQYDTMRDKLLRQLDAEQKLLDATFEEYVAKK